MCLNEAFPYWVWGSNIWVFIKQEQEYAIKKGVPTWEGQDRHHLAQVECARQRYDLDRFSLLPVSWWWWETGFRIDNRTIKRGSQVSNLTVSFERAQTFAYLASYLSWFLFGFYPCEDLELVFISMTSSSSSKTDFEWISYGVFDVGGFTDLSFRERSNLSSFGFILPCCTMMFLCMNL